jgi:hypothetical protein
MSDGSGDPRVFTSKYAMYVQRVWDLCYKAKLIFCCKSNNSTENHSEMLACYRCVYGVQIWIRMK